MPRSSSNVPLIIAVFILGVVLATFLPYIQEQFKSPNIIFLSTDRYVCPDSFYGTFDISVKNIGGVGQITNFISSEEIYFENKDKEITRNDTLSYLILENQDLKLRFIPASDYKYRDKYEELKNATINLQVSCQSKFFGTTRNCGTKSITCVYENTNYPHGSNFKLIKET